MAWVTGIREVKLVTVAREEPSGMRKGPALTREVRQVQELPPDAIAQSVARALVYLPTSRGAAGPCGSWARCGTPRLRWPQQPASPFAWSIANLIVPLNAFYAAYQPPARFGARSGRHRGLQTSG